MTFVLAFILLARQAAIPEFRPDKKLPDGPDEVAYQAAVFLKKAIEAEAKTGKTTGLHAYNLRFFSMHNLSSHGTRRKLGSKGQEIEQYSPVDDMVKVLLFTVNQVNRVNPPVTLTRVTPDLFAVHIDEPGWTVEAWENLASKDPYFRQEWIAGPTWRFLTTYTYSEHPIMRADQFVAVATVAPDYYGLLGLPKTLAELKSLLGIDEKVLDSNNRIRAGIKTDGLTVTRNNRRLEFYQGAFDLWQSLDVKDSKDERNALTQLDVGGDKHKFKFDAGESIFQLGNGFFVGGFLSDKAGNRADEVPIDIASDPNFDDRRVRVGRSCITCHDQGIRPFESDQVVLLQDQIFKLRSANPDDANKLLSRYDGGPVQRAIRAGQEDHRSAVEEITQEAPEKIAAQYANVWRVYADQRVDLHTAAIEAGLSDDVFTATLVPSVDPNLLYLIGAPGRTIPRDVWENKFNQVMLLRGPPAIPKGRIELPANSPEKTPKPVANEKTFDIIGSISLKTPTAVGEKQEAKIVVKTKAPTAIKEYFRDKDRVKLMALGDKLTEHEIDLVLTSDKDGFPAQVKFSLDSGESVVIPVTVQ